MKLLNYTTSYLAIPLLIILTLWAAIFYFSMLDEIYDSMDDGLENQKLLVMQKVASDSSVLYRNEFDDGYYKIQQVYGDKYLPYKDVYQDTLMFMQNEQDFEPVRMLTTVFKYKDRLYQLRVITSMVEEDDLIEDLVYSLVWLYLGLVATILILNNFLLKKIWKPFHLILKSMKGFKLGVSSDIKPVTSKIDEFEQLNDAVMKLVASNLKVYSSQKQFIENASHELQTPIAIMRNKLEFLAESDGLKEEQMLLIDQMMGNINRMNNLNKTLLLLSKIDNNQFVDREALNVNMALDQLVEELEPLSEQKDISVNTHYTDTIDITSNRELLNILISNLLKNAIIHSEHGSTIHIYITANELVFENNGAVALDSSKIFDRFYKQGNKRNSTGLGLALTKSIADKLAVEVVYEFQGKHVFKVIF